MTERRLDPLTGEWRTFATTGPAPTLFPPIDGCPLCPTLDPSQPTEIPDVAFDVAVVDDRFPVLAADPPAPTVPSTTLYPVEAALGATELVVYASEHELALGEMGVDRLERVIAVWADRYAELGAREDVAYVFVFENRGEALTEIGQHPHGQIHAYPEIPPLPRRELEAAQAHLDAHGTCVLCDVVARERADGVRIVDLNQSFLSYVPFAARFPYEVHLIARRHATSLLDLTDPERSALAEALSRLLKGLDRLYGFPLPYVMSMHQAPTDDGHWLPVSHFHMEFLPLHRTATELKYLAGAQLGAGAFINDSLPESTAAELRTALAGGER